MRILLAVVLFISFWATSAHAQVFTNKDVGKKNQELVDSLKRTEYPYALPILGKKVAALGYDLPYSAGFSAQYFWQVSDLVIENLKVGFNGKAMYDLDGLIRFDKAEATAAAVTVRPDIWLFPFLNVYGILGKATASTKVGFGLWVPDSNNVDQNILSANSVVDFNTTTYGLGFTPTIGIGGGFLALDMNVAWTDVPQLSKPARSFVFGPRLGKNFKLKQPQRSVAIWIGGFRVHLNSGTDGSIALKDVLPPGEMGGKIDAGVAKVDNAQQQVDQWWAGLSQQEQNSPVNKAKYESANNILERAGQILASADNALNTITNSTVQYSMDKRPKDPWNIIIGAQFQLNKHIMVRFEYGGLIGSRTQVMTGLQYRFGL